MDWGLSAKVERNETAIIDTVDKARMVLTSTQDDLELRIQPRSLPQWSSQSGVPILMT